MNTWSIIFNGYNPEKETLRESLCTLANGYFGTRGAAEETVDDGIHYPGVYLAGGYNRMKSRVSGETIENEDFVNWPNWLPLSFKPEGGQWFYPDKMKILEYRQELKLKEGILERNILVQDDDKRETAILTKRLVHIEDPHKAACQWILTPRNWSGTLIVKTAVDGTVYNNGVKRYASLNQRHLQPMETGSFGEDGIYLTAQTLQSHVVMAVASKTNIYFGNERFIPARRLHQRDGYIEQELEFTVSQNMDCRIEKITAIHTSRDHAISEPLEAACKNVLRAPSFEKLYITHRAAWSRIWQRCDIPIEGDGEDQQALRFHIFHIMQTLSKNTIDLDIGAPSRGLHGEAYRGHILWDELFIFPFLNFTMPEITRELLMYRYRRLPEARYMAAQAGYKGAMFPWQSGSDGREESQKIHLNPNSGRWLPDHTYLQRHVNAAIAFNISQYFQTSGDTEFISFYGAEMFLDIASFWASITEFDPDKQKYVIKNVVGPDEYHTHYPDSAEPGIDNNAYTNIMAVWTLMSVSNILEILSPGRQEEILGKLRISSEDLAKWDQISRNMYIPIHDGIIEQFEGFESLEELDWARYRRKYGEILRLDRILENEDDDVNRYKACKQADVLMLFYLFPETGVIDLLDRLGYPHEPDFIHKNIQYYGSRSSHGSTLSKLVYSWVVARSDREKSWLQFREALRSDLHDVQGGTTSEGIHLGAMAGSIDLVQRCYTGMEIREAGLAFNPLMPTGLQKISTRFRYKGMWLEIELTQDKLKLSCEGGWSEAITVILGERSYLFSQGDVRVFDVGAPPGDLEN